MLKIFSAIKFTSWLHNQRYKEAGLSSSLCLYSSCSPSVFWCVLDPSDLDFFTPSTVHIWPLSLRLYTLQWFLCFKKALPFVILVFLWLPCMLPCSLSVSWPLSMALPPRNGPSPTPQRNLDKGEGKQFLVLIRGTRSLMKAWHSTLPFVMTCFFWQS